MVWKLKLKNLKNKIASYNTRMPNDGHNKCHISSDAKGNVIVIYTKTLISIIKNGKLVISNYEPKNRISVLYKFT